MGIARGSLVEDQSKSSFNPDMIHDDPQYDKGNIMMIT